MKLLSIFAGQPKEVNFQNRVVLTGIYKQRVKGEIKVNKLNLEGDRQADLTVHGGIDKAVYAYPVEHYEFWEKSRSDLTFEPGVFGENLAVSGLSEKTVSVGDQFRIGSAVFAVTTPRMPCYKLGIKMGDPAFVKDFMVAERTGFYFKVLEEGVIVENSDIEKIGNDGHRLTIDEVVKLYTVEKRNETLLEKAVSAPGLPGDWVEFFQKKLAQLQQQKH